MAGPTGRAMEGEASDAAVFRYSRTGQVQGFAGILVGACVLAFLVYDSPEPAYRWGGLGLSVVLAAVCLFYLLRPFNPARYADHTLTIDREGIACGVLFDRKVPWEAISHAHVLHKNDPGTDFLVVGVRDPGLYPPAGGKLKRVVSVLETLNSASMDLTPLDGTGSDVDAALDRFMPRPSASA